ncbi:DUF2325 domain-containing protein [Robertmurraya sp. FSL R5-0851]|uniref:DUF2325 domain-containing protein n=1 Tax=Robertmurraya sp. FSL R5-0851 TaxID=2921584 RepID=UPI0030F6E28F
MKKTVAVFGGSQETTYKQIGKKHGVEVLFHCGKSRNGGNKKEFRNLVKKADCVVILLGALGHVSMDIVKEVCKELGVQMITHDGRGASGAIQKCVSFLNTSVAA